MSTHVHFHSNVGRYNWARNEKHMQISLHTPFGNLDELFPEDFDFDQSQHTPETVLEILEERNKKYLFNSDRKEFQAKVDEIRKHMHEVNVWWMRAAHRDLERRTARAWRELTDYQGDHDLATNFALLEDPQNTTKKG